MDKQIVLDVGGRIFKTFRTTLGGSQYFTAMLDKFAEGKSDAPIFIDRSPILFEHVLNYLRDPNYIVPSAAKLEFLFYGIDNDENKQVIEKKTIEKKENINDTMNSWPAMIELRKRRFLFKEKIEPPHESHITVTHKSTPLTTEKNQTIYHVPQQGDMIKTMWIEIDKKDISNIESISMVVNDENISSYPMDFIFAYNKIHQTNETRLLNKYSKSIILYIPFWFDNKENNQFHRIAIALQDIRVIIISKDDSKYSLPSMYYKYTVIVDEKIRNQLPLAHTNNIIEWVTYDKRNKCDNKIQMHVGKYIRKLLIYRMKKDDHILEPISNLKISFANITIFDSSHQSMMQKQTENNISLNKNDYYYVLDFGEGYFYRNPRYNFKIEITPECLPDTNVENHIYYETISTVTYEKGCMIKK